MITPASLDVTIARRISCDWALDNTLVATGGSTHLSIKVFSFVLSPTRGKAPENALALESTQAPTNDNALAPEGYKLLAMEQNMSAEGDLQTGFSCGPRCAMQLLMASGGSAPTSRPKAMMVMSCCCFTRSARHLDVSCVPSTHLVTSARGEVEQRISGRGTMALLSVLRLD